MTPIANGRISSVPGKQSTLLCEVEYSSGSNEKVDHPSLTKTLWRVFGPSLIPAIFLKLCYDTLGFVQPQLLG